MKKRTGQRFTQWYLFFIILGTVVTGCPDDNGQKNTSPPQYPTPPASPASPASPAIEVRTLQMWNVAHPFDGPKNFSEDVLTYLMHPTLESYANKHNVRIEWLEKKDILGLQGPQGAVLVIKDTLKQLDKHSHYLSRRFESRRKEMPSSKVRLSFDRIVKSREGSADSDGGILLARRDLELLPILHPDWLKNKTVSFDLTPDYAPKTLGAFAYPEIRSGTAKGKKLRDYSQGLYFRTSTGPARQIHVLSFRRMPKDTLINTFAEKSGYEDVEARVYLEVPYKKLLKNRKFWTQTEASRKTLKVLCPNYNNPEMRDLFGSRQFREIVQQVADLTFAKRGAGVMLSGLRPVDTETAFEPGRDPEQTYGGPGFEQRLKEVKAAWKRWQVHDAKSDNWPGKRYKQYFQRLANNPDSIEKPPKLKVHYADGINDQKYMENFNTLLTGELRMLQLDISHYHSLAADQLRELLQNPQQGLGENYELIVFDVVVPHNRHVERYFAPQTNIFGLSEEIALEIDASNVTDLAARLLAGKGNKGTMQHLGKYLREEIPCILLGEHIYYIYERTHGQYRLPPQLDSAKSATAIKYAERIRRTVEKP
ncbi:MAG: hypothetical protein GY862_34505 [Gammaproteobacteria bacterium]|nr:hypothetical protein [Gammaproteobacteria bacterium]